MDLERHSAYFEDAVIITVDVNMDSTGLIQKEEELVMITTIRNIV